ncbi:MAG: sulfite reductase, dissimilatory-type subunit alpha [Thermoplasmata archaeon]|jgi:sulfite reductase alpha subunit
MGVNACEEPAGDPLLERGRAILRKLEDGPWPSHVTELRKGRYPIDAYAKGLGQGSSPWYGGSARIPCVLVGFIARRTKDGKHTELHFRVYHPSGQIYRTDDLRKLLDLADEYGLGTVGAMGQTGDLILPIRADCASQAVDALRDLGTDLGGTGDTFRDTAACVGPALCEYALFDSLAVRDFYFQYPDIYAKLSSQFFPFKVKLKVSACPMDCSMAAHRSDFGFVGFWEGAPAVDQAAFRAKVDQGEVSPEEVVRRCPGSAIGWDPVSRTISFDGSKCRKSMNCIRKAFPAIRAGPNRKIAFTIGGNSKGRFGPKLSKPVAVLDDPNSVGPFMTRLLDYWSDRSPHKDRLGDLLVEEGLSSTVDRFKDSLPVTPSGHAPGGSRIVNSCVLSDSERGAYSTWAEAIAKEYDG